MPEWFVQGAFGVLLSIIGYMVVRIDRKLDRIDERQAKTERECVTWADLDKEMGPLKARSDNHESRIVRMETVCEQRHTD